MANHVSYAGDNKVNYSVPPFAPFDSFSESAECAGAGVLAVQKVFNNLALELELVDYPYARIFSALRSGDLDLALIFKNSTLVNDVEYIGPLSLSEVVVITQKNIRIQRYADLYELENIAVLRKIQINQRFDQDHGLNKVSVGSLEQGVQMLKYNRVSAVIGSRIGLEYALRQQGMDISLMDSALHLGTKEWGLHLTKESSFISLLPLLTKAVQDTYKKDLMYRLYHHQIKHCLPAI
tara:strand:+ start:2739 stop:3449 length:711 start_codon:yes stop_codon:yes gene_type:complete